VLRDKPIGGQREARWLEVPDAALLLESARTLPPVITPAGEATGAEIAYPLLATFLLTGGRRAEVLGLELDDVSSTAAPSPIGRMLTAGSRPGRPGMSCRSSPSSRRSFAHTCSVPDSSGAVNSCSRHSPQAPKPCWWMCGSSSIGSPCVSDGRQEN
jgi:hypothetical protein